MMQTVTAPRRERRSVYRLTKRLPPQSRIYFSVSRWIVEDFTKKTSFFNPLSSVVNERYAPESFHLLEQERL